PPSISLDNANLQLYPINKNKCHHIDPVRDISFQLFTSLYTTRRSQYHPTECTSFGGRSLVLDCSTKHPSCWRIHCKFIDYLVSKGLYLPSLHLAGLSLGAQMAGVCGRNVKSGRIRRIT
ncbi:hypothetical protein YQE_09522, partial [Dendroctonus ponderosae]